ncbi:hypothetical protein [Bradyrhizobium paxllaeri]|uniref:hypothetical protein n=1 Tax=Bradyrhizobium paxllaeri TaxID=190148 RepID=UPI000810E4DF|nr:hypothetical protein [Bradyrhizobium paxllaeri]
MNKKWDEEAITKLRNMAEIASVDEIAYALDSTPGSVVVKASEHGISLRKHRVRVLLPKPKKDRLDIEARRRGLKTDDLVRHLLIAVIDDDMFDAVLDDDLAAMKREQAAHAFIG